MEEDLMKKLKYIRFNGLCANWDGYLEMANRGNFSHIRFLKYIIEEEFKIKRENSRNMRLNRAKIPEKYVIETFPFEKQAKLKKKTLLALYDSCDYMARSENIIWMGPTGVGKTGLATAFLVDAIHRGYNGRFIAFPELMEILYQSIGDHSQAKVINQFATYDCLLIDELGYIEVEEAQVGLFFTLMSKRHKKKSTLITTNLGFGQWTSFLKNPHLTVALIDRLTENSLIINMKECVSLMLKINQVE